MAASAGYLDQIAELLDPIGPLRIRRMFSGAGIFDGEIMFALISDDTLYLKADETTRHGFEAEDQLPFSYDAKGRTIALPYWRVPDRLLDEPDELRDWARTAIAVARRTATAKRKPSTTRARRSK